MIQTKTAPDPLGQEERRKSFGPEVTKRPKPSKLTPSMKQVVAKVTSGSPNCMKATSSSEARRQSQSVQASSDKKRQIGKKLEISFTGDKKQSSSISTGRLSPASFKRSNKIFRCWDVNSHRETCSSFLKDSKYTESLMLTPLGVLKLCPYTYCSINAHLHIQFPPHKSFISARRRKMSEDDGCVDNYVNEKKDNGITREIDIQVIDFEAESMRTELGEAEDSESASAEMMSSLGGEDTKLSDSADENFDMMIEDVGILDEKQTSMKVEVKEEADGEKVEERIEFVSNTEDTLFILERKPCKREECIEDCREFNSREPNYHRAE